MKDGERECAKTLLLRASDNLALLGLAMDGLSDGISMRAPIEDEIRGAQRIVDAARRDIAIVLAALYPRELMVEDPQA
jgi:hypothetical protein